MSQLDSVLQLVINLVKLKFQEFKLIMSTKEKENKLVALMLLLHVIQLKSLILYPQQ